MFLRFGYRFVSPSHVVTHMRAATALSLHPSAGEGHSSSSVFVHASFACISGIRRPQFPYMPRSHVYRGRCSCLVRMYLVGEHNVYRGVDILRAVEESADSSILRSFEKTHLRCWSSVCPFSSLDSSNSNASVVTRQSFDDASDWPSRSSDRIDFQKHQITSLHVSSLLRPFTSSSQRGKVLAYPSSPELIGQELRLTPSLPGAHVAFIEHPRW